MCVLAWNENKNITAQNKATGHPRKTERAVPGVPPVPSLKSVITAVADDSDFDFGPGFI
jgi:hypothetical protein